MSDQEKAMPYNLPLESNLGDSVVIISFLGKNNRYGIKPVIEHEFNDEKDHSQILSRLKHGVTWASCGLTSAMGHVSDSWRYPH